MPFLAGKAERFEHREVEQPLRFFHPGRNDVTLENTVSTEADAQCKTATMPRKAAWRSPIHPNSSSRASRI